MKHNWEYSDFDKIATTITPKIKIDKSSYLESGIIPIVSQEDTLISGYWNNLSEITSHNKPVVIFGDHSRVLKYIDFEFVVGADGVKIIEPKDNVSTKFLYHFLKWYNVPSLGYARHFKLVKEAKYPLPPMEVQEQIVAELDGINAQIDRCRELLSTLDSLATSLFYDTFGDPVTNPKGWPVRKMKDLTSLITNGTTPKGGQAVYVDSGITFFRSQNVWRNKIIMDDVAYLDDATNASMKGSMLKHNDILITKTGRINTENSSLGRSALFEGEDDTANINGHVYLVRLNKGMSPRFVLSILLTNSYRDLIRKVCVGAIDKRQLNLTHIEQFPIITPPLELQENYVNQIKAIEAQQSKVEATIAELQTLLDSRMDYWFN